ncbi:MAG: anti-sigma regulatory factor [Dehalococcoidia bacterium]
MTTAEKSIAISEESDIVAARQRARMFAVELGFRAMDQSRITTAVSELARNVVRYANNGEGRVHLREIRDDGRVGIEILVEDEGPGIPNIDKAMEQGFSSGTGLGLGLGGTKRLMDEMLIESAPGTGTRITIRKWRH